MIRAEVNLRRSYKVAWGPYVQRNDCMKNDKDERCKYEPKYGFLSGKAVLH